MSSSSLTNEEIAQRYSDLLPQLSRSATTCVKLLSSSSSSSATSTTNEDAATSSIKSHWPQGEEYEFHKAFRGFNSFVKNTQQQHQELLQHISVCYREETIGQRSDNDTVDKNMDSAEGYARRNANNNKNINPIEAVDALFENVDHLLDSLRGVRFNAEKQEEVRIGVTGLGNNNMNNARQQQSNQDGSGGASSSPLSLVLLRPQDAFTIAPDNFAEEFLPFVATTSVETASASNESTAAVPRHPHRQYSSKPGLHPLGSTLMAASAAVDGGGGAAGFQWPQEHLVPPQKDQIFLALEQTPLTLIDTPELLQQVVDEKFLSLLRNDKDNEQQNNNNSAAIAIDLEHHSDYSYLGFTCLIQISTRTEDFIIDALKLRDEMWRLAPVFHNPKIVKVLHSAQEDVKWLQRDFGLFLVNLFDTATALQTLRMPHSLAFLVDHICQIKLNKQHQTGDWRIRPLPQDMLSYARQDTHYLLYCWDRLRTMLASADTRASVGNLLLYVYNESKRTAAALYRKPAFDADKTWREVFGRSIAGLFPRQLKAIQNLFNWRETCARTVDTSPNSILTNGQLLSIACRLPSTAAEVLRMTNPATVEVRKNVRHMLKLLDEARSLMKSTKNSNSNNSNSKTNEDGMTRNNSATTSTTINNSNSSNNNKGAAPVFNPSSVHQPMTGTLPSVQQLDGDDDVDADDATTIAVSSASASSSSSSSSGWMSQLLFARASQTRQWNPESLAATIEVPMTTRLVTQAKPASLLVQQSVSATENDASKISGQRRQRDANANDDDENGEQINDTFDNNNNNNNNSRQNDDDDRAAPFGQPKPTNTANDIIAFPKSLAEEHGGLGRQTRKRATKQK